MGSHWTVRLESFLGAGDNASNERGMPAIYGQRVVSRTRLGAYLSPPSSGWERPAAVLVRPSIRGLATDAPAGVNSPPTQRQLSGLSPLCLANKTL